MSFRRNPIEMLFGIYSLSLLTASPDNQYGVIEGLSKRNAVNLQGYLLTLVETTLPDVKEKRANQILNAVEDPEEQDRLLHAD